MGDGDRKEIEFHAEKLREFILHVRKATGQESNKNFMAYLVAHSMGGLVCRCYLQNKNIMDLQGKKSGDWRTKGVHKLFTYATPHGGIEFRKGLGWLEGLRDFLSINNSDNFGEKKMRDILSLNKNQPLHSLSDRFPAENVFCLIGTDSKDYSLVRKAVGPKSDGLVQIENAYVQGSARAYTYRSHSGHYGIVNSESGYRNLERFLFGDTKVKVHLEDVEIELPEKNKNISASYNIESIVSIRGLPSVSLNKRAVDTFSSIFRTPEQLQKEQTHLFTSFLSKTERINKKRQSLGFSIHFRILPTYHMDIKYWKDKHYEGQAVFDDRLILEIQSKTDGSYKIMYGWGTNNLKTTKSVDIIKNNNDGALATIKLDRKKPIGLSGDLVFEVFEWNI